MPINYGNQVYWERRYKESPGERFDWLVSSSAILPIIKHVADKSHKILYAGCGNSTLLEDMHEDGYSELMGIDFSKEVIQQQTKRNNDGEGKRKVRPELKFKTMDATNMKGIDDGAFDMVIDKCMLDAILCGEDAGRKALRTLREVNRVLNEGGTYLMFSYAAPKHRIFYLKNRLVKMDVRCFKLQHMDAWLRGEQAKEEEKSVMSQTKGSTTNERANHYCYVCTKNGEPASRPKKQKGKSINKQIQEEPEEEVIEEKENNEMDEAKEQQPKDNTEEKAEEEHQNLGEAQDETQEKNQEALDQGAVEDEEQYAQDEHLEQYQEQEQHQDQAEAD